MLFLLKLCQFYAYQIVVFGVASVFSVVVWFKLNILYGLSVCDYNKCCLYILRTGFQQSVV